MLNALSRLKIDILSIEKTKILKLLYKILIKLCYNDIIIKASFFLLKQIFFYYIILIEMFNRFK